MLPPPAALKVLIVEDDEATREAFALILSQEGYRVETAGNGLVALEQVLDAVRASADDAYRDRQDPAVVFRRRQLRRPVLRRRRRPHPS